DLRKLRAGGLGHVDGQLNEDLLSALAGDLCLRLEAQFLTILLNDKGRLAAGASVGLAGLEVGDGTALAILDGEEHRYRGRLEFLAVELSSDDAAPIGRIGVLQPISDEAVGEVSNLSSDGAVRGQAADAIETGGPDARPE